jgi:PBSX family phage portal protein
MVHLREADLVQEIYGLPEYLSALQSGLLNEAATIFRRRYFLNGSHAGYILYINDAKFADADADELADAVEQSKGPGNFKNVFLHIPGGSEKGVQVIPVGEAAAKDEFLGIKNTTRDDILAAHRVPPVLLGVVPQNTGGFGDVAKAADVFHFAEIEPLQLKMLEVNDQLGVEAVRFRAYERQAVAGASSGRA